MEISGINASARVYPLSVNVSAHGEVCMARIDGEDYLIADEKSGFSGEVFKSEGRRLVKAPLNHVNACVLRELFPFTSPVPVLRFQKSMGVGDRLGIATEGHIRVFEKYTDVHPVFAQQSIRELRLTRRTYEEVLDCVTFAAYKYGYKKGFGADGDHLKTAEEIKYALSCGYSIITLDSSEYIRNDVCELSDKQIMAQTIPDSDMKDIYVGEDIDIGGGKILHFSELEFKRAFMTYGRAIDFIVDIFNKFIASCKNNVDFEISIDETITPTTPLEHFFVAHELIRRGVKFETIAPRFCGEFQKGIDYIGNLEQFEREFEIHAAIARYFGYKISIHSGSDKFSVFPAIGRHTKGVFHLKTAGTNWLEAIHVISLKDPALYRDIHKFALSVFNEAKKYYHVSADLSKVPELDSIKDSDLPELLSQNEVRQLIHITYGLILNSKEAEKLTLKDRIYKVLKDHRETYAMLLDTHIGNHLKSILSEIP